MLFVMPDLKKFAKEKAPEIVCEKNDKGKYGTVTALCTSNKITINCAGKKSSITEKDLNKIKENIIKGICPNAKTYDNFKLEINESKEAKKECDI